MRCLGRCYNLRGVQMKTFPKHKVVGIDGLIPYALNSRTHSDAQVAQIAASIKEFGFLNPIIIDGENGIIAGHGRVLAAQKLGMTELPVVEADHLTDAQRKAYVIADNRLALNAGWDNQVLTTELAALQELDFDLDLLGFDGKELAELLKPEVVEGQTDEDEVPEAPEVPITKPGDIWVLGNHRLMCGDSTMIDSIESLMAGTKADMIFTDPPYGDDHAGMTWKNGKVSGTSKIKNDSDISYLADVCSNAISISNQAIPKMVFFKWSHYTEVEKLFSGFGKPSSCCVWDRDEIAAAVFSFNPSHEFCFFWGSLSVKHNKSNLRNVWRCKKEKGSKKIHPTVKPVQIISDAIDVSCVRRGIVVDFFGGSGSTLIACETIGRRARLMELDPKYCDVIIKRWQDFTGQEAILESTGETYNAQRGEE